MSSIIEHIGELPEFSRELPGFVEKSNLEWMMVLELRGDKDAAILYHQEHVRQNLLDVYSVKQELESQGWKTQVFSATEAVLTDIRHGKKKEDSIKIENESPYRKVFADILMRAIELGASDIHVESRQEDAVVRLAVAGGKRLDRKMTANFATSMIRFLYDWEAGSGKGSAEGYYKGDLQPQKARIEFQTPIGVAELRVQITPAFPEGSVDMVIRILRVRGMQGVIKQAKKLSELGYLLEDVKNIEQAINLPNGMSIWAGVVNSGKSTSIVNVLSGKIAHTRNRIKVVSLEDPPESEIFGATQIPVEKMKLGLELSGVKDEVDSRTYAEGIKIALRMDIDILFIGEIRGAEMAIPLTNAIRSGHYVYATIHAGSAVEALGRLWNLGLDIMDMASPSFVNLVVYQKLLPELCPHCRISTAEFPDLLQPYQEEILAWYAGRGLAPQFFRRNEEGCDQCNGGVVGRKLIAETLFLSDALRERLMDRNLITLRRAWIDEGGRPIAHHGLLRAGAGEVDMQDMVEMGVRWTDLLEWVRHGAK
jgi:type II secretory ATPase GspE/PulE/Tfp pilus assembly ATPase PilB-like protein